MLERAVCGECRVPMKCTDTSVPVIYNDSVVYHGTEFTCPSCLKNFVPITSSESIDSYYFTRTENTIEIEE